ncbi:hypothetical protein [Curtanaerobium respiraculi]|uniref:hypothetical protein n=1 Tax=Curtanaerobium respiraculi TaxID=2949669 RepID=UPI0024B3BE9E|nr:hypothetical protein [Curtanaerobium respiraculi]
MSGRCERVYVRLTPGEKDRALDFASRNGLTVSQLVRVLIQLPADCTVEGARTAVVLDRASACRLEREMRRWGNHYNQAVHALNRIAYYAERGSLRTDEAQRLLSVAAGKLEDLNVAVVQLREETHGICSHAIVGV